MASYLIVTCRTCETRYNPYWGTGKKRDRCPGNVQDSAGNMFPCPEPVPGDEQATQSSKAVSAAGELPEAPKPKPKAKAKAKPKKAAKGK